MRLFITLCLATFLMACEEDVEILTAEELVELFSTDHRIAFSRTRFSGTATISADNTFEAIVPLLGNDSGVWWLDSNQVCSRWEALRRGQTLCISIGQLPDETYVGFLAGANTRLGTFRIIH
ncbi:hypothetical protein [Cochlodiniinecator piscidefendens]|uniref:hypothetical protein n=1 Tax=Cochlodiniinecator piscidefendens TaxID=2715756 RepID=UPI00140C0594|nr:hypothetical protein [Cochlodiniinecator piscidefendens]